MQAQATELSLSLSQELLSQVHEAPHPSPFRNRVRRLLRGLHSRTSSDPYLLGESLQEAEKSLSELTKLVHVEFEGELVPRAYAVAATYLRATNGAFAEPSLIELVNNSQAAAPFAMDELWALRPALIITLLERYAAGVDEALNGIREVAHALWDDVFAAVCTVDRILARDPIGAYESMDDTSKDLYRTAIMQLARYSKCQEVEVAAAAVDLAAEAPDVTPINRAVFRRRHIGYFLIDKGRPVLEKKIGYRPPLRKGIAQWVLNSPTGFYLIGVELATFAAVVFLLSGLPSLTPILGGLALLLFPATHAAVHFMNILATAIVSPRRLAKLDFKDGIPAEFSTIVAVPALLLSEEQVRGLVRDVEVRYLANSDPNLFFGLLTDHRDAPDMPEEEEDSLLQLACRLIDQLNTQYCPGGQGQFFLLHRFRSYNPSEGAWIGWERKRGKILDLNTYVRGAGDSFPVKCGATDAIRHARFVITLDSDTQLPPGAAAKLAGAMAHPLNRAVLDPFGQVVEGYGIIQPHVAVSVQSVSKSRLAQTYSGQTGFDIYTSAISDTYQDLFGEGIFTGKGIYEIDVFRQVLESRFPTNQLLSHDLIEGIYARTALASDVEVVDDYPSHYSAYSRRQHRWIRGDWQVLRWLLPFVPNGEGRLIPNPISLISRWKIVDNVRRSLIRPATLLLLLAGWFVLPDPASYWTLATVALLLIPVYSPLLVLPFRKLRKPSWRGLVADAGQFLQDHAAVVLEITFLIEQTLSSLDAIVRSVIRTRITRRKMLEWETAAQAESTGRRRAPVDLYLQLSPWVALAITVLLTAFKPAAIREATPFLILWALAPLCSRWLNRRPGRLTDLTKSEKAHLEEIARKTWKYFDEFSTAENHYLIPDNVSVKEGADQRISPTNLGLLLNARIGAVELGHLSLDRFIELTQHTLQTMLSLERHHGHFLNWYNAKTLEPIQPLFVSTVDSGNLAVSLWSLKQACLKWGANAEPAVATVLQEIAAAADGFVAEMDFRFLYRADHRMLSVGYDATNKKLHKASYDLLASEARSAVFVAIASGQIPHSSWTTLGRAHTIAFGKRVLVSWTGTAFEYLMPALWIRQYQRTLLASSMEAMIKIQQHTAVDGRPWGMSECAYGAKPDGGFLYGPCGLHETSMHPGLFTGPVVSPYSTMLALSVNRRAAYKNLIKMEKMGWLGDYGFYESADYSRFREDPSAEYSLIRCWMAHHQGMSLLAMVNVLRNNIFQELFHAEPRVEAYERLLHEKLPADIPTVKATGTPAEETEEPRAPHAAAAA